MIIVSIVMGPWPLKKYSLSILLAVSIFLMASSTLEAYNYPSVLNFDPIDIGAGNQNWMIDQMQDGDVVIGNENGLLTFNGSQWQLYDFSALNAVKVIGNRIYSGGYRTMGFWEKRPTGQFSYTSLVDEEKMPLKDDEQFWQILVWENGVLFQSHDRLIHYDESTGDLRVIEVSDGIVKLFVAGEKVFFQDYLGDLYTLSGFFPKLFFPYSKLPEASIINIFSTNYGIFLFTADGVFYSLQTNGFVPWEKGAPSIKQTGDFFSALQLNDGSFALGSITSGLFLVDEKGVVINHLDRSNNLSNNTVLSIFEDNRENLWLGLDNGISMVQYRSLFREYIDQKGQLGTVYTSILHKGFLYVGSNQGLFYKKYPGNDAFSLVENTNGQVWTLFEHGNDLFCGHNLGTYLVEGNSAKRIASENGTWKLMSYPGRKDVLIQGNFSGIHLLRYSETSKRWEYFKQLEGFTQSFRQFYILGDYLYYYHSTLGLNRIKLTVDLKMIGEPKNLYRSSLLEQVSISGLTNQLLFSTDKGLFSHYGDSDSLTKVTFMHDHINAPPVDKVGRFNTLGSNRVAFFQGNDLYIFESAKDSVKISDVLFFDENYFKPKKEFENISLIDSNTVLLGMTNGYLLIDLNKINNLEAAHKIRINRIMVNPTNRMPKEIALNHDEGFPHYLNNFTFHFNTFCQSKYQSVAFQYKLEGDQNKWSKWSKEASVSFYKLSPGPYSFKVRARVGNQMTENVAVYNFWIKNPWYLSLYAYAIYIVLLILLIVLINAIYNRVYEKKQADLIEKAEKDLEYIKLRSEQELMREKNERLRSEIEAKNKELAVTAMSIVKKNEFLIEIRDHLKDIKPTSSFKPDLVIRSINREIENEESWEMLKNAFENVDKDFIQLLLEKHPSLTPNDLKLCTYLRLNMSSKEIATLMNISVRSMETKRYRLRKKLGLSHDTNLVEYILNV
jgi:AraC family chitin signaling transcriptional activator